jgi:hypothetical protein
MLLNTQKSWSTTSLMTASESGAMWVRWTSACLVTNRAKPAKMVLAEEWEDPLLPPSSFLSSGSNESPLLDWRDAK